MVAFIFNETTKSKGENITFTTLQNCIEKVKILMVPSEEVSAELLTVVRNAKK